ncbi:MAG: chemotaxis protein CheA [Terriglobales bacterium]|jgi:two-component system chemotaxis sensor kinase CheA
MTEDDEIVKEFLVESHENLDRLDRDLVALEKQPSDREILASIFRTIHTIKGTSGFLAFGKLEAVAHVGENLLAKLRDGQLKLHPELTTTLLAMVDAVRQMLASIEASGNEGERDDRELIAQLTRLLQANGAGAAPARGKKAKTAAVNETAAGEPATNGTTNGAALNGSSTNLTTHAEPAAGKAAASEASADQRAKREPAASESVVSESVVSETVVSERVLSQTAPGEAAAGAAGGGKAPSLGDILISRGDVTQREVQNAVEVQRSGDPRHIGEILVEQGAVKSEEVLDALRTQQSHGQSASESTIRVDVGLLDQLMNLVGELVLARNQILQFTKETEEANLVTAGQRLNLIATELQESVMKTRMQPIGSIWSRFPRTVRDVALACGKQVRIQMEGKETELDKTLIEAIKDPLTHLVRNAIDHGIERPEARRAAGKDPEGLLLLRAFHEGGQVNIEIGDDGAGLNLERVVAKAVQKGLISAEQAARLTEREMGNLIFAAGLSTAEKITNVSGRGVGMDVVKTNIERIGGTVDLQSAPGKGTTVKVKIPLTLAIVPALIVTAGGQRFAIPQVSLLELVGLEGDEARKRVEWIQGAPVYRLRGNLLPLVHLNHELGLPEKTGGRRTVNIVVLRAEDRQFGLVVDEINDTEEIVVKPLRKQLKSVKVFAGASIMGDGRVALILDVLAVARHAQLIGEGHRLAAKAEGRELATQDARQTLLLFRAGVDGRMAIPLSSVARLEEFKQAAVERSGRQEVVQYRGHILPLVRISEVVECGAGDGLSAAPAGASANLPLQVIVYTRQARSVGLVVENILDIVEENLVVEHPGRRAGVLGSAMIQQRVTDLVDIEGVVQALEPGFFEHATGA